MTAASTRPSARALSIGSASGKYSTCDSGTPAASVSRAHVVPRMVPAFLLRNSSTLLTGGAGLWVTTRWRTGSTSAVKSICRRRSMVSTRPTITSPSPLRRAGMRSEKALTGTTSSFRRLRRAKLSSISRSRPGLAASPSKSNISGCSPSAAMTRRLPRAWTGRAPG